MTSPFSKLLLQRAFFLGSAAVLAVSLASAQTAESANQGSTPAYSSSTGSSSLDYLDPAAVPGLFAKAEATSAGSGAAAGQDTQGRWQSVKSKLAFEGGGGANAPLGDKQYITWGGNFTVGGGLNFSKNFGLLAEYQFLDNKLPGAIIAETGATGGHAHIWGFTLAPVFDLFPKSSNDIYVTGGGGFYRKVTSFTDPEQTEYCYYYYCGIGTTNVVVGHYSSNQGGWNVGAGYQHRMGGVYGDSKMRFFAEVRYLDVLTPASQVSPNGLGTTAVGADTKLLPITFGIRY